LPEVEGLVGLEEPEDKATEDVGECTMEFEVPEEVDSRLPEATGIAGLFGTSEGVFETDDLRRAKILGKPGGMSTSRIFGSSGMCTDYKSADVPSDTVVVPARGP
jgi:hypothetical protein